MEWVSLARSEGRRTTAQLKLVHRDMNREREE